MLYLNKVTLIGNLTKNIELKALPSGIKVASFSLATNRSYKKDGKKVDNVEFHNLVAFGKTAETLEQWVKKGDQIYLEGRLQTRNWEDKETGKKLYRTEVVLETFLFGNKTKPKTGSGSPDDSADEGNTANDGKDTATDTSDPISAGLDGGSDTINPEDIPF